jgi:hypothetical protein
LKCAFKSYVPACKSEADTESIDGAGVGKNCSGENLLGSAGMADTESVVGVHREHKHMHQYTRTHQACAIKKITAQQIEHIVAAAAPIGSG